MTITETAGCNAMFYSLQSFKELTGIRHSFRIGFTYVVFWNAWYSNQHLRGFRVAFVYFHSSHHGKNYSQCLSDLCSKKFSATNWFHLQICMEVTGAVRSLIRLHSWHRPSLV